MTQSQKQTLLALAKDRPLAHRVLFRNRHKDPTPPFHVEIQLSNSSTHPNILYLVYRGGAKSSISEESIAIGAIHEDFYNCIIVGANETRAKDRLTAIKHEIVHNTYINALYGDMVGAVWAETKIILKNSVCVQCLGQGQSIRGVKYLEHRPQFILLDDLEDLEDAVTPEARLKMIDWFFGELIPAADPKARFRMNATPLDAEALAVKVASLPNWKVIRVPIKYRDDNGDWQPSWPERHPLTWIDEKEQEYKAAGKHDLFLREYMLQITTNEVKPFKSTYFRYQHYPRSYEAVYAVYDPARTVKATSAHTGKVVYSWINNKLVVWESGGYFWQPSEIVDDIFDVNQRYNPIFVAVEKDGLEEFIMQPLRHATLQRNVTLPLKDVRAPKGKFDFIRGLEPFFKAGEVIFAGDPATHAILTEQLLNFPTGRIDVPNALAYALKLRLGLPVYEDFTNEHVAEDLTPVPNEQFYLAVNATPTALAAVLCQFVKGSLLVFADYLAEGDPSLALAPAVQQAALLTSGRPVRLVAPPAHFGTYDPIGLRPAARALPATLYKGGPLHPARDHMRRLLRSRSRGAPLVRVSPDATFTLRALAGGYAFSLATTHHLEAQPIGNTYSLLMNAVESLISLACQANFSEADDGANFATAADGRRYRSARVQD